MDKRARLLALAKHRQAETWPGYHSIADYHHGAYECDHVSPVTKSAGHVDAQVMILLQDWSSHDALSGRLDIGARDLGYTPSEPTFRNLERLLSSTFDLSLSDVYATNLLPFVKPGGMSASLQERDLVRAAVEFGIPQIEIVRPKIVICLGMATFNAVRKAAGLPSARNMQDAIDSTFSVGGSRVWFQAHTGHFGQISRNKGGVNRVTADWERMKDVPR